MKQAEKFSVNAPKVVHETIEGEVVIVNLDKGDYYSLVQAGADIWNGIISGISRDEIIQEMNQRYAGDRATIEKSVNDFIAQLQREELIKIDQTDESINSNGKTAPIPAEINGEKPNFEPPSLNKYTDMEELLALDPIHEVDTEVGWPSAKVEV
ncbi:MAG TPA: pyrroloquinoline quinone biosynthesis protein PqqD [Cyanobacteria bacterium UBA11369]|nr:pyrroloquinoline quinone biosynthesis protein PqqD [Cyanobacteria bacterium UBA11371]HBE31888.1 pyrroloquinoline quinone biosynthesis protein PqqD [Cyanobacteria bacterium UBA11368]HBE53124.1 pyrroloquinoline quinone biosynthesis protein PqqD [Cyanobacteria bacterium UBA11369]